MKKKFNTLSKEIAYLSWSGFNLKSNFIKLFRMNKMMEFNVLNNVDIIQRELDLFYAKYS